MYLNILTQDCDISGRILCRAGRRHLELIGTRTTLCEARGVDLFGPAGRSCAQVCGHCLRVHLFMRKSATSRLSDIAADLGKPPFSNAKMASVIAAIRRYKVDHKYSDWLSDVFYHHYVQNPSLENPAELASRYEGIILILTELDRLEDSVYTQHNWHTVFIDVVVADAQSNQIHPDPLPVPQPSCVNCELRRIPCVPRGPGNKIGAGAACENCHRIKKGCVLVGGKLYDSALLSLQLRVLLSSTSGDTRATTAVCDVT